MRLYLLPISTRRTLIYCQRLNAATPEQNGLLDKGTKKAADMWASWEKKDSGWQRKVVDWGNEALKRIPFEEWGLKSIPPLSERRLREERITHNITTGTIPSKVLRQNDAVGEVPPTREDLERRREKLKVEVLFPPNMIPQSQVLDLLKTLGTERQGLHRQRLLYSVIGMPLVAPFAIVPVVPNLPFFYLVFRAWSHWRAVRGSQHLQFMHGSDLLVPKPSQILEKLYEAGKTPFETVKTSEAPNTPDSSNVEETMVLSEKQGKRIAEALEIPELYIELERAVWQVERAVEKNKDLKKWDDLQKSKSKKEE